MNTNKNRPENKWYFDWSTFTFNYHDTKSKPLPIFVEGTKSHAVYKWFFTKGFWYVFWYMAISIIVYLVTFPWWTCHWTSELIHDASGVTRYYDCTGHGLTLVDILKWVIGLFS